MYEANAISGKNHLQGERQWAQWGRKLLALVVHTGVGVALFCQFVANAIRCVYQ